jgi:hypothetical protein
MRLFTLICRYLFIWVFALICQGEMSIPISATQSKPVYLPIVSKPPPVYIAAVAPASYRDGTLAVQGEVVNFTNTPVYDVMIEGRFYDANGQLRYTVTGTTILTATLRGQLNPFELTAGRASSYPTPFRSEARIISWRQGSDEGYRPATVISIRTQPSYISAILDIYIDIRNDEGTPLTEVRVSAWSLGQSSGFTSVTLDDPLMPGETRTVRSFIAYCTPECPINVAAQGRAVSLRSSSLPRDKLCRAPS